MIQLDNEMGMIAWVRNILDTNADTIQRFAAFLKRKYRERLVERYPADEPESFLLDGIRNPQEQNSEKIIADYRVFYRSYLKEYAGFLISEARANEMDVLPVINIHGFANGGKTFPIGISQLIDVIQLEGIVSATDVYPGHIGEGNFHQLLLVNEMTKAVQNDQQALFSIEFQAGGNNDFGDGQTSLYDLHTRLCISCGMRAINHYLFFDGENDPILSPVKRHDWGHPVRKDGSLRKHYHRYRPLSDALKSYGTDLILSQPETVTTIGFILDDFMTEVNNPFTQEYTHILTHQREVVLFDLIARGLALTHRPFKSVELSQAALDPGQIPLLWVMMEKRCSAELQQKLVDYVAGGGKLILAGRMCVEDHDHTPCTLFKDFVGIREISSDQPFTPNFITAFDYSDVPVSFLETYTGTFDQVFARQRDGGITGFVKRIDQGKVMVFGAALAANTLEDLDIVHQMGLMMDCFPLFELSQWADVRISRGAHGSFLFVNNYQDDPVETLIRYKDEPLFGGNPVSVPARRGLILPLDWQVSEGITIKYCTSEIIRVQNEGSAARIKLAQDVFKAELSLSGYTCENARMLTTTGDAQVVHLAGSEGWINLLRV
jgi:beta-galactosidase